MSLKIKFEHRGLEFESTEVDRGNSIVTISKQGEKLKEFLWPTYKIFNIEAHADDICDSIEDGLMIAGSTGLGGNVYSASDKG